MRKKVERRQDEIAKKVLMHHKLSVNELAAQLSVTPETVRMDLSILEKKGILYRTHGGAVARDGYSDVPMEYRVREKSYIKRYICSRVVEYIKNDDNIFVDPSSTALPLGKLLYFRKNVLVVTNCLEFVDAAHESRNQIILLGGTYSHSGKRTEGHFVYDMLEKFSFDVAILGMDGCMGMDGPGTQTEDAIAVNRRVLERSQLKILISGAEKFTRKAKFCYAKFNEFDILITDRLPEEWREKAQTIQVVEARQEGFGME